MLCPVDLTVNRGVRRARPRGDFGKAELKIRISEQQREDLKRQLQRLRQELIGLVAITHHVDDADPFPTKLEEHLGAERARPDPP